MIQCTAPHCVGYTGNTYKVSLSASDRVYDGTPAAAEITKDDPFPAEITAGAVLYEGRDGTTLAATTTPPKEAGKYTASVVLSEGDSEKHVLHADFEIKASQPATEKPVTETVKPTERPASAPTAAPTDVPLPQTGDTAQPLLWLGLTVLGVICLIGILLRRKK